MNKPFHSVRRWKLHAAALLAALCIGAQFTAAIAAQPQGPDLAALADEGSFSELLQQLKSGMVDHGAPPVAGLIQHIERYQRSREENSAQRAQAYQNALAEIATLTGEDQLDKALFSAAEAQSLAIDKKQMLGEPPVKALIERSQAAAAQAEKDGQWLEAMSFYRSLDVLFNQDGTYHDDLKRIANHVRVLRVYAPEIVQKLYEARLEKIKALKADDEEQLDEDLEPLQLENEDWKSRLAEVDMPMLRQALVHAARHHIDNHGYRPLMLGAVESLLVMVNTPGLETAFPDIADAARLAAFRTALTAIADELKAQPGDLRYLEVDQYIARIERTNDSTIRLPNNVLAYELAEGAVGTLDDYSNVIWPLDLAELYRTLQGNFTGVGIMISSHGGKLIVASPLPGGPAIKAGVRFDDVIASVDGESTEKWTLKKAVDRITGPEGSVVELGVVRQGAQAPLNFKLKREKIKIDSIRGWERAGIDGWDYYIDPDLRIGYVRMTQFIPQTADDLDAAIAEMQKDGPINGLILDLRFNPGGLLRSAVSVVDRFITEGVIVSTVDVNNEQQEAHRAGRAHTYPRFPVAVLVNQGSASASEIVAGALQDYGRAQIVGARSFGKGSVQDMYHLQGGKALLKLTTQYYRLPSNRILHRRPKDTVWGVEPDLIVDVTDQQVADAVRFRQELDVVHLDDEVLDGEKAPKKAAQLLDDGIDPQLDAALLFLKAQLVVHDIAIAQRAEVQGAAR